MNSIAFGLFYIINWIITLLPLRLLYLFSDFLFLLLYYFPGYRRKIVQTNLRNAFPEKSEAERRIIERKFYRHFADLFVEILKLTHLSDKEHLRRCRIENPELLEKLYSEGRDAVAIVGHYGNWEYLPIISLVTQFTCVTVYKPLKNKHFDRFMNRLRTKQKMLLSPMSQVMRDVIKFRSEGKRILVSLLADQTPARGEIHYWTTFLNQDTPVYLGAEKIASKYDMAVVFFNHQKIRRGYYNVKFELLFEHTKGLPEYVITETHVKRLEELIREKPEYWLWSHRRWKYKRPNANG
ncbi:MAG: lysophospholipid acyltransferase family protein [Bacteroidales bacterium]